ncbi:hypothetical protein [Actinomadura citrea]|uniref:Uncharacterized protein n=1 Tax=Actinomadura citrea TaxID=46158 RepID=A0A7Y9GK70_9ACTN|nr:hypothetical protein [Actinomadura citrea]NYE17967.1 hypothetical protein [Actinomadura citrea]
MGVLIDEPVDVFCRQARRRSDEHRQAMAVAVERDWRSIAVGILRQELDSLIRVHYLLDQSDADRSRIIAESVSGMRWPAWDRQMVRAVESQYGWASVVYDFGCSFIHLTRAHDYLVRDPFQALSLDDREIIADFLNRYHRDAPLEPVSTDSAFDDIYPYLSEVLKKISTNLELALQRLQQVVPS